ncbi:MAG: deoxyribodipyrimidine photo-lyase [Cyclobacteriaceae bacterium]
MEKVNIFWFKRDLRLDDNAGLYYALKSDFPVVPIFIFDRNILDKLTDKSDARVSFIHDQIENLKRKLESKGSSLKVFYSTPLEAFDSLLAGFEVQNVYTNRDYEPYAKKRDAEISQFLKTQNVELLTFKDHVIFEEGEILNGQNEPYKVFTPYKNAWLKKFEQLNLESYRSATCLDGLMKMPSQDTPTLESMNFRQSDIQIPSMEIDEKVLTQYEDKRNYPAIQGTSKIGVHLRFGTLSIREKAIEGHKKSIVWLNELIWREFYMMILANFPHVVNAAFKKKYDQIPWVNNETHFQLWCQGMTGYPLVDAGMRELNTTGFMHNRVRMVVASFLTKHLLVDWRWGEAYFAEKLLDFELSSNNGGWQWAAGTGTDAQPYFRVFNPQSQLEKFDKDLVYVKKWIPEWGTDKYPQPIVEHKSARLRAIKTYKDALA